MTGEQKALNYYNNSKALKKYFSGDDRQEICPDAGYLHGTDTKTDKLKYIKVIPCGKEACQVCGQKNSLLHKQRFIRGIGKILSVDRVGYLVITFPDFIQDLIKDKKSLNLVSNYIRELLKSHGFKKGVMRWHFSGDKKEKWFPHLNILLDNGYIEKEKLNNIKQDLIKWLNQNIAGFVMVKKLVINYQYTDKIGKKIHKWRYICRPTLLNTGPDLEFLSQELWNFRNIRWWAPGNKWIINKEKLNEFFKKDKKQLEIWYGINICWKYKGKLKKLKNKDYEAVLENKYLGYGVFEVDST